MSSPNILVVGDEPSVLQNAKTLLETDQYKVETVASGEEALQRLNRVPAPNLIVLDLAMPGLDGLQTLESCRKICPEQKVVMISCSNDTNKAAQAIKLGASDYITKPLLPPQLQGAVRKALNVPHLSKPEILERGKSDELVDELDGDLFFLAASPVMKQIRSQAALIAKVNVPVLFLGESGVGKEILARLIHKMSVCAHRSMVKINCAALPADLLESELFGYEAGAFTGAHKSKPGKFELAHKGSIMLDEIGEMSVGLQAKLLQVLQDGTFSRLGGRTNVSVDARVLAATNIDVKKAIAERRFREDLYYRLNAFTITVPPLRERREEIPILLRYYMSKMARQFGKDTLPISDKLIQECMRYQWPGNLRQLGNFVKRYLVLEDENAMMDELQDENGNASEKGGVIRSAGLKSLVRIAKDGAEVKEIQRALESVSWNRKSAAEMLNISYKALLYKIKQHGLSPPITGNRSLLHNEVN